MKKVYLLSIICLLITSLSTYGQGLRITGKVTTLDDGSALAGATVQEKGTTNGTQTDSEGRYSIQASSSSSILVFSFVGTVSKEVTIGSQSVVDVQLSTDSRSLSDVVVVGYGTQIKKDLTGAIGAIKAKDIENLPLPSVESALQGRVSGVFINSGSGKLGQGINIRVRGISSVSASNQPLFVIDGQPVITQALGSGGEPDNPLASIAPDDIKSMEVLKDASAAAIYGARAANGVILITTKSGTAGKTKINFGYFTGISRPTKKREWLNSQEYIQLFTDAANNASSNGVDWETPEQAWIDYGGGTDEWTNPANSDWANEAFQKGAISQYSFSLDGGDAKTKFFVSASYNDQKGIILANRLTRANGRINIDHKVSNKFTVGVNLMLNRTNNYRVTADNNFTNPVQLNAIPPIQAIRNADGTFNRNTLYTNVLNDIANSSNNAISFRSISNGFGQFNFLDNLFIRSEVAFDIVQFEEEQYDGRETLDGQPGGRGYNSQSRVLTYNTNNVISWTPKISDNHNLELLGGVSLQKSTTNDNSVTGRSFPNDKFKKIASAAIIAGGTSTETGFSFLSYFARANYKLLNKYLLGASYRIDGSSRFGKDNRYGAFPAVSAGWVVTEENFLKDKAGLSFLKLRASYGTTGNAEIGNFASRTLWSANPYASQSGIIPDQVGVNDLKWEKTNQFDLGLDFGLFNDRITGEIDYFNKKTSDLLLIFPVPATNGYSTITRNVGNLENNGFEFSLNTRNLSGPFSWTTSFNISTYKNKITNLNGSTIDGGSRALGRISEGQPYGYFYGPKYAGVNPDNGNAQYYNEDGKVVDQDEFDGYNQKVGDPNPDFYGGLGNHFAYKGFDLDIQTQFVSGNDLYNIAGFFQSVNGDYYDNQSRDQMAYWKKPGDVTQIPQPRLLDGNGAIKSSRWVQDGSYFRVKNVALSYTFPKAIVSRLKLDKLKIFMAAQNLFTFTKYEGYDPEVNASYTGNVNLGHDFYTPPQAKTVTIGVNLGL
jgi:TonB-linked SusC/RagA family outer membrane protein